MSDTVSARRSQTRDRLVDAAVSVFAEKGVLGASVEEICEAAGFTRGAFYSNFDGRDALCLAMLQRQAEGHLGATRQAIASVLAEPAPGTAGLDEVVRRAIGVFLSSQADDRASILAGIELRLYAVREASIQPAYLAFVDRVSAEFVALIEQGAASLGYRLSVPGKHALTVLEGVFEQAAVSDLLAGGTNAVPDRAALLGGVLKSMLVPTEG